jgi:hypothetical protein
MSIVLVGSSSGSITLQEPAVAGTTVLDLPATSGTILTSASAISASSITTGTLPKAQLPAGSVLQVVQGVQYAYQSYASSNSDTFADVSGFSATITPSSTSSKILVMFSTTIGNERMYLRLVRDAGIGVAIAIGDLSGSSQRSTVFNADVGGTSPSYQFLDSPSTTSAITYKVQVGGETGKTFYIGAGFGVGSSTYTTVPSTIILMEIKG